MDSQSKSWNKKLAYAMAAMNNSRWKNRIQRYPVLNQVQHSRVAKLPNQQQVLRHLDLDMLML